MARSRGSPILTPPSAIASIARKAYAGPLPLRPVTASRCFSSSWSQVPTNKKRCNQDGKLLRRVIQEVVTHRQPRGVCARVYSQLPSRDDWERRRMLPHQLVQVCWAWLSRHEFLPEHPKTTTITSTLSLICMTSHTDEGSCALFQWTWVRYRQRSTWWRVSV